MRIRGCDLHARQQTIAKLDSDTGELEEKTLEHQDETVREFYSALHGPILVGIECRVGHPAKIRQAETRIPSLLIRIGLERIGLVWNDYWGRLARSMLGHRSRFSRLIGSSHPSSRAQSAQSRPPTHMRGVDCGVVHPMLAVQYIFRTPTINTVFKKVYVKELGISASILSNRQLGRSFCKLDLDRAREDRCPGSPSTRAQEHAISGLLS
jgi:hypothetical protein